ncbi:MAG: hypothetical protein ACLQBL_21115 [Polyangiaceae bacterium]
MDSVVSKLQETGHHVVKKSDLVFARTREAGKTFISEVRDAGREIAVLVKSEAKGWRRFLTQRTTRLRVDASAVFTPKTFERELLSRVDGTLRTLDAKVRERIAALEKGKTKRAVRKTNGKGRARRVGGVSTRSPSTSASAPASVRH